MDYSHHLISLVRFKYVSANSKIYTYWLPTTFYVLQNVQTIHLKVSIRVIKVSTWFVLQLKKNIQFQLENNQWNSIKVNSEMMLWSDSRLQRPSVECFSPNQEQNFYKSGDLLNKRSGACARQVFSHKQWDWNPSAWTGMTESRVMIWQIGVISNTASDADLWWVSIFLKPCEVYGFGKVK